MKLVNRAAALLALGTLLTGVPGCMENIALIGRPTIEEGQDDVVGEVERVDLVRGEFTCVQTRAIGESSHLAPMRRCSIAAANILWRD